MFLDVFFLFQTRCEQPTANIDESLNQLHVRYIKCMQITYQGNACLHDVQY